MFLEAVAILLCIHEKKVGCFVTRKYKRRRNTISSENTPMNFSPLLRSIHMYVQYIHECSLIFYFKLSMSLVKQRPSKVLQQYTF